MLNTNWGFFKRGSISHKNDTCCSGTWADKSVNKITVFIPINSMDPFFKDEEVFKKYVNIIKDAGLNCTYIEKRNSKVIDGYQELGDRYVLEIEKPKDVIFAKYNLLVFSILRYTYAKPYTGIARGIYDLRYEAELDAIHAIMLGHSYLTEDEEFSSYYALLPNESKYPIGLFSREVFINNTRDHLNTDGTLSRIKSVNELFTTGFNEKYKMVTIKRHLKTKNYKQLKKYIDARK
jgi:hypothetical protein